MQTLDFASNDVPSSTLTERVGLGLLGLQEYAHEYWLTHVLRYFEAGNGPVDQQSPLLIQLSRFSAKHMELLARAQHKTLLGASDSISSTIQHSIPEGLQFVPEPRTLICQVLDFRHNFDTKQASEGPGKSRNCGWPRGCANRNNVCRHSGHRLGSDPPFTCQFEIQRRRQVACVCFKLGWPVPSRIGNFPV